MTLPMMQNLAMLAVGFVAGLFVANYQPTMTESMATDKYLECLATSPNYNPRVANIAVIHYCDSKSFAIWRKQQDKTQ